MGTTASILYVEDNADHAELVLRCFADRGIREQVVHVADGELALAYLERVGRGDVAHPLIVLLDLRLPKVDGFEVLRTVKESAQLRAIPVIVLTTSKQDSDIARAYHSHANSYLVKPDQLSQLGQLVNELSSYWLLWNTRVTASHGLHSPA